MEILSSRATRSTLPLSNAEKRQMGIQSEELSVKQMNQHLPTHDLCLNQIVMYQKTNKQKVVSSENHKALQGTQKLHDNY